MGFPSELDIFEGRIDNFLQCELTTPFWACLSGPRAVPCPDSREDVAAKNLPVVEVAIPEGAVPCSPVPEDEVPTSDRMSDHETVFISEVEVPTGEVAAPCRKLQAAAACGPLAAQPEHLEVHGLEVLAPAHRDAAKSQATWDGLKLALEQHKVTPTYTAGQSALKKPLAECREFTEEPEVIG